MTIFIQSLNYNLRDLIVDVPNLPSFRDENGESIPKPRNTYNDNAKAKHIIICAINSSEFNRVSSCVSAKEMWDRLEVTYEGTNQVKEAKISMLVHDYEMFTMNENEDIKSMFTRFMNIINALQSLDKTYTNSEMVRKILRKFKKFLANKKKFGEKPNKKFHQKGESSKIEEIICFECNKSGHYKSD
ncbi:UBN2 domain-containing protein [Cephalotus follicularis]|uniref:UBN2 domain-containing protein n=1 Tax=Cephalotus follicularis TaxID=3775 RepID=A0A1Q3AS31_CEPFO|nr:UBN2 domain-containing protein [Cephalotus follicularis]